MQEKAEAKERERIKEEVRKGKKLEAAFRNLLNESNVTEESKWEEIRGKLEGDPAFEAVTQEYERVRIFKEFIKVRLVYKVNIGHWVHQNQISFVWPLRQTKASKD